MTSICAHPTSSKPTGSPRSTSSSPTSTPAEGDRADLHAFVTVTGTTEPLSLPATVSMLHDGAVRVATETTIDYNKLGVRWNSFGMLSRKTTITADTVFRHATV